MVIGPFVNASAVFAGSVLGAACGNWIPKRLRLALPLTFGLASMGMGVPMITKMHFLPAVILALLTGSIIGELIYLEDGIKKAGSAARNLVERLLPQKKEVALSHSHKEFVEKFVTVLVLFCASSAGIFGSMNESMTGDSSILLTKSMLDFLTAAIFAAELGFAIALIALPLLIIQLALAMGATTILPLTSAMMIGDFSAVGGIIMLAMGMRICGIQVFPVANLLPGLFVAMPISALWIRLST